MQFFKKNIILTVALIVISVFIYYNFTRIVDKNPLINENDSQYVNDLYMSDGRIYNEYLDAREKKMYDLFLTNLKTHTRTTEIKLLEFGCSDYQDCSDLISMAGEAILIDHPEVMSYAGWSWRYKDGILKLTLDFAVPFAFLESVGEARIERIISDIKKDTKNMSEKEKIKYVYNWMGNNTRYDKTFTWSSKNQSVYSVFMSKEAVCAGFAKASQIIFQNIGIESYGVAGQTGGPHMWNIIEYDGKYYFFDSTVATSVKNSSPHYYDGLKQEEMNYYIMDFPDWYPEIEKVGIF